VFVFALLFLACGGSEVPAPAPQAQPHAAKAQTAGAGLTALDRATATSVTRLEADEAKIELKTEPFPEGTEVAETWTLEIEEIPNPKGAARKMKAIRGTLPFQLSKEDQRFRPSGLEIFIDGKEVEYSRATVGRATESTWRINGDWLIMSHETIPERGAVTVRYPGVKDMVERHDVELSEREPADFIRYRLTHQGETRDGLMIPAPGSATWEVTLPKGATFNTWLAMEQSPLAFPKTNGAVAKVSLTVGDETHEVCEHKLLPKAAEFTRFTCDLSAWEGEKGQLKLTTDPGKKAHPHVDWVFWGAPRVTGAPSGNVRRVVVVGIDTMRPDKLSANGYARDTTPNLDAFLGKAVVFDNAWTPAPRTRPSFRSATTGRRPLAAVGAKNIGAVFREQGWATAGIVANIHLQPRFGFDKGFDWWRFDGIAHAKQQVDDAVAWLEEQSQQDAYLFLHFMDPHLVYDAPGEFTHRYVAEPIEDFPKKFNRWEVLNWERTGKMQEAWKPYIEALHDGEIRYMDGQLGRLFEQLDELPGDTLVVVHNDHGEEFWEHGGFEHNHSLYDEVTRSLMMFRPGGGLGTGVRAQAPATLMDIGPTLFDLVGFEPDSLPTLDGISLRPVLEGGAGNMDRPIGIAHMQYAHERWGVVHRGHKYMLHTGTGNEELYDLAADPNETKNLAEGTDTGPWVTQLVKAHGELNAGHGWRVQLMLDKGTGTVEIDLPAKALGAGILDPEAVIEHRANLEWGEIAKRLPEQVGMASLSEDGTRVTIAPGPQPEGIVWVRFAGPVDPTEAKVRLDGKPLMLETVATPAGARASAGSNLITLTAGQVVVPPPTEHARMMKLAEIGDVAVSEQQMLEELGYIGN
jgi:arylsulfatase A-like enzyme